MGNTARPRGMRFFSATAGTVSFALVLSACSGVTPKLGLKSETKEYFSEAEYGVKASPRVASAESGLKRGGGRYQVGKPYQIKGRWYHPKEDPDYVAEGKASWYGSAFHGRLTANGEVYDMNHLTAAHPTMPLPSYARVTNLHNGSSVIVRVNDRGPFAKDRVIDLSKRAAEMLDYTQSGVAKVRVAYVGPAPLHGQDANYLMASYRPNGATSPSDGLPSGVMLAMDGPTPERARSDAMTAFAKRPAAAIPASAEVDLPNVGPFVPDRPRTAPDLTPPSELALLSYADQRVLAAAEAFDSVVNPELDAERVSTWWRKKGQEQEATFGGDVVNLGSWSSKRDAERIAHELAGFGSIAMAVSDVAGQRLYSLSLEPGSDVSTDETLRAAWAVGASDAFVVRQ